MRQRFWNGSCGRDAENLRAALKVVKSPRASNAWIVCILISIVSSAACAGRTDLESSTVDGTGDAPGSRNGGEVSATSEATGLDRQATEATNYPATDLTALRRTESEAEEGVLSGTWIGTARQFSVDSSWSIEITFEDDGVDIRHPSLACGGQLQPISESTTRFVYRERIRFGLAQCIDNGRVVLERTSRDTLSYEWSDEFGALDATGSLTLRTED